MRRNLRLFEFFREPENPCTPKYTRIFRTPKETSKIHQNSDFLGNDIIHQILTLTGGNFLCHCEASTGVPAGYCVPVGKSNKQAKDKQLSLATIVWSKVKFMTRDVAISRKGNRIIKPTQDIFLFAWRKETNKCCVMKLFARFSITQLLLTIKLFLTNVLFFLAKCFFKQFSSS